MSALSEITFQTCEVLPAVTSMTCSSNTYCTVIVAIWRTSPITNLFVQFAELHLEVTDWFSLVNCL